MFFYACQSESPTVFFSKGLGGQFDDMFAIFRTLKQKTTSSLHSFVLVRNQILEVNF